MQKPRPKEAAAPDQQRSARENRGPHEGAPAPLVVSGGEKPPRTRPSRLTTAHPKRPRKPASERRALTRRSSRSATTSAVCPKRRGSPEPKLTWPPGRLG